jgi:hypothetical protein
MMVHPDYRRKGISAATAEYAIQRVEREKGMFMTAYSIREESLNSLLKVGWKEVMRLPILVFPIRFHGIVNRYLHFQFLSLLIGGVMRFFYFFLFRLRKKNRRSRDGRVYEWDETYDLFWEGKTVHPIVEISRTVDLALSSASYREYVIYRALQKGEMKGYIV